MSTPPDFDRRTSCRVGAILAGWVTLFPFGTVRAAPVPAAPAPAAPAPTAPQAARFAPCGTPPAGMVCIPGGPFWRGSDHHRRNERPRARVTLSTFFLDTYEATNPVFERCVRAGPCKRPKWFRRYRGYHGATQPAVPVSWSNALKSCLMLGKRLPTEAEWEKAARTADGRIYPWGNDKPTCRRAHYQRCRPARTLPVGRFPPNPYGLFDLAGNGYEWVHDWGSRCYSGCRKACASACSGRDPQGPCGGALRCPGHRRRVLRGGSWYWPTTQLRTSWRRFEYPSSGGHRLGFRCATRNPRPTPRPRRKVRELLRQLRQRPLDLRL